MKHVLLSRRVHYATPEVSHLGDKVVIQQDITQLQVSVDDLVAVEVLHSHRHAVEEH
jgi:hypothetical protein